MTTAARRAVPRFLVEMFSPDNRFITLIAALAALGGFLFGYGAPLSGKLADLLSRKWTKFVGGVVSLPWSCSTSSAVGH